MENFRAVTRRTARPDAGSTFISSWWLGNYSSPGDGTSTLSCFYRVKQVWALRARMIHVSESNYTAPFYPDDGVTQWYTGVRERFTLFDLPSGKRRKTVTFNAVCQLLM